MATYNETGHAKNVANLGKMIEFVDGYGVVYNPTKTSLTLAELKVLETNSIDKLDLVLKKIAEYNDAINHRIQVFENLKKRSTRVISALEATETTPQLISDAKGFNRKIQGGRAKKIPTVPDPNNPTPTTQSVSQQSYDQLIQHLKGLIEILKSEPNYAPNETDLQIISLDDYVLDLMDKNTKVSTAFTAISNARIDRDKILYDEGSGLFDTVAGVKKYIKSIFGATSSQFAQVKGIVFTNKK